MPNRHAADFLKLHHPGQPLILLNIWDPGSARAVAAAGATAIATGSASVAGAFGFADGEQLPIELALDNARRIVAAVDLPVTVDFEGGYAADEARLAENLRRLAGTGAVGCNLEDQKMDGGGVWPVEVQARRIAAARAAVGEDFFLNARTDLFLQAPREQHAARVEEAIERGRAYEAAGASGLFVPGLADLALLERICARSPLPVNYMALPGGPSAAQVAAAGVARISHGPFPWQEAMQRLSEAAAAFRS